MVHAEWMPRNVRAIGNSKPPAFIETPAPPALRPSSQLLRPEQMPISQSLTGLPWQTTQAEHSEGGSGRGRGGTGVISRHSKLPL